MGMHQDLDRCAEMALRDMIAWIVARTGLSREDAYMLCSLAGDLRITQTVNGNKGVHMMIANALLETEVWLSRGGRMTVSVAIIGLGIMGRRMLEHMGLHAGYKPVALWDPDA
jgi:hypothetical protein